MKPQPGKTIVSCLVGRVGARVRFSFALLSLQVVAAALAETELRLSDAAGLPGTSAEVGVNLSSDQPIVAVQYEIHFDPAKLSTGPVLRGQQLGNQILRVSEPRPGVRKVLIYSLGKSTLSNGEINKAKFHIFPDAPLGPSPLSGAGAILNGPGGSGVGPVGVNTATFFIGVRRAKPEIQWPDPADITYGTPLSAAQLNADAGAPGVLLYEPRLGDLLSSGLGQTLSVIFIPDNPILYEEASASVSIDVLRAPLVISADHKMAIQDDPLPSLTANYSGLVANDTPDSLDAPASLSTTATPGSPPGFYPIVVQGAADPDYDISFVNGVLTITANQPPVASVEPPEQTVQYSDPIQAITLTAVDPDSFGVGLTAVFSYRLNDGPVQGGFPEGLDSEATDLSPDEAIPGARAWRVSGNIQASPGQYRISAELMDDRNGRTPTVVDVFVLPEDGLVENVGPSLFFAAVPYSVQAVDAWVTTAFSGLRLNRFTRTFDSVGTVGNISTDTLAAPLQIVIEGISRASVTVANASGSTAEGHPYLDVPLPNGLLQPGESVQNIVLKFNNPGFVPFSFKTRVRGSAPDWARAVAELTLAARAEDVGSDGTPGNIETATVTFFRDAVDPMNVLGTPDVPVVVDNPADPNTGTASTAFIYPLSEQEARNGTASLFVLAALGGNYRGVSAPWPIDIIVQADRRLQNSIPNPPRIVLQARILPRGPFGLLSDRDAHPVRFRLRVLAPAGEGCVVERSEDLIHWVPIVELQSPSGEAEYIDPLVNGHAQRFYRARLKESP